MVLFSHSHMYECNERACKAPPAASLPRSHFCLILQSGTEIANATADDSILTTMATTVFWCVYNGTDQIQNIHTKFEATHKPVHQKTLFVSSMAHKVDEGAKIPL